MEENKKVKSKFYKKWWFWVIVAVVLFIIGSSNGSQKSNVNNPIANEQQTVQEQAIKVSATQLASDYEANEVSADNKYKGKLVEVSGSVKNIGKDITDQPYVSLNGNSPSYITDVQCMFDKENQDQLVSLKKDMKITLKGNVSGKMMNVLIRNCALVQ